MIGFCTIQMENVEIDGDRRCLADGSYAIPPSTGCVHQRWEGGAWSVCRAPEESVNGLAKPCKPQEPGTWRPLLDQQERAVAKRDADRKRTAAALGQHGRLRTDRTLSAFPAHDGPPKLATAHKERRTTTRTLTCAASDCDTTFTWTSRYPDRRFCSRPCASGSARGWIGEGCWFRDLPACVRCHQTTAKHKARGICVRCNSTERRQRKQQRRGEIAA